VVVRADRANEVEARMAACMRLVRCAVVWACNEASTPTLARPPTQGRRESVAENSAIPRCEVMAAAGQPAALREPALRPAAVIDVSPRQHQNQDLVCEEVCEE